MTPFRAFVAFSLTLTLALPATANEQLRARFEALQQGYQIELDDTRLLMASELDAFYARNHYQLLWLDDDNQPTDGFNVLREALHQAHTHGLPAQRYRADALESRLIRLQEQDSRGLRHDFDMLASDALLVLLRDLAVGRTDPALADPAVPSTPRPWSPPLVDQWPLSAATIEQLIAEAMPESEGYHRLRSARSELVSRTDSPDWSAIAAAPLLRPGSEDPRVIAVRERLLFWGDLQDSHSSEGLFYDSDLANAVERFQRRHGLSTDGIIGPRTWAALNVTPEQRLQTLDVNLERWRWLPTDLGERHVRVNIAGYDMQLVENDRPVLSARVVVGRDYRRTPVFSDRIRYLVLNPDWVVPPRLAAQDKLPEFRRDPSRVDTQGFVIYDGWGENRRRVDTASIDWNAYSARHFPFRLVQQPGPLNALGQVKFMFPNQYNVYLHDTPAKDLFQQPDRSFSSGCVRVENPLDLAEQLLKADGWSRERLNDVIAAGQTRTVFLRQPVPVHIQYWTAWVSDDGELHFRQDVYRRDEAIDNALRES